MFSCGFLSIQFGKFKYEIKWQIKWCLCRWMYILSHCKCRMRFVCWWYLCWVIPDAIGNKYQTYMYDSNWFESQQTLTFIVILSTVGCINISSTCYWLTAPTYICTNRNIKCQWYRYMVILGGSLNTQTSSHMTVIWLRDKHLFIVKQ